MTDVRWKLPFWRYCVAGPSLKTSKLKCLDVMTWYLSKYVYYDSNQQPVHVAERHLQYKMSLMSYFQIEKPLYLVLFAFLRHKTVWLNFLGIFTCIILWKVYIYNTLIVIHIFSSLLVVLISVGKSTPNYWYWILNLYMCFINRSNWL